MRENLRRVSAFLLAGLVVLALYVTYLQFFAGPGLARHPRNPRLAEWEKGVLRGGITSSDGEILARTVWENGVARRLYPAGPAFGPLVGYTSRRLGEAGLEAVYRDRLTGRVGWRRWNLTLGRLAGHPGRGDDLVLTVDARLQRRAAELLAGRPGAAVVLDPNSGAVLALVSSPGFDPARLEEDWERLRADPASPLLNRAVQGLYPPGSTFKLVTGAAALSLAPDNLTRIINCPGYLEVNGRRLNCPRPHGEVDFTRALAVSCNVAFATYALEMGAENFWQAAQAFGLGRPVPFDLPVARGSLAGLGQLRPNELAESAIGQGKVLETPLGMALITAAVAGGGRMPRPYLVAEVRRDGRTIWRARPAAWGWPLEPGVAAKLTAGMVAAVEVGTATAAALPGYAVAGKTGTAENPGGTAHAWFVGFAPAEAPRAVAAVVIEHGGRGGQEAAPVARELLAMALER